MKFSPALTAGTLVKRYKRFLADVIINNQLTTMHVANTGAMTGCAAEGDAVWFSESDNKKRKYPQSWELTEKANGDFICVNTLKANQLVEEALTNNVIAELASATCIKREVKYGAENSKIDFLLKFEQQKDTYVEVKSVTLLEGKQGYFPDAVTTRGQKHLRELTAMVENGQRAVLLFAVLHTGIHSVKVASHIDPIYAQLFADAMSAGVEVIAYKATITADHMVLNEKLPLQ